MSTLVLETRLPSRSRRTEKRSGRALPSNSCWLTTNGCGREDGAAMDTPLAAPVPELPSPWRADERLALQAEARRFATGEVLPLANRLDPVKGEIPRYFLDRLGRQGYFGIMIPAECGGMGRGVFEYCMIAEELARAWMSVAS